MGPLDYNNYMVYGSQQGNAPQVLDTQNAKSAFFQRYLWQDLIGVLKWEVPETWDYDYFTYCLYMYGYVAVINTDKFGVIPQQCGLQGWNVFYRPTTAVITNPLLQGILTPRIGLQCEIIKVNADYGGMWDLITYYADLMALTLSSIGVNIVNSKLAYLLVAGDKAQAATLKDMYSTIASGNPAYCIDEKMFDRNGNVRWQLFDANVGHNYIADKLLVDLTKIKNLFYTEIGIPNSNQEKKERMVVDEVNANNVQTSIGTMTRLERMQADAKKVEKMFGIKCSVDWRIDPNAMLEDGGIQDASSHNNNSSVQRK